MNFSPSSPSADPPKNPTRGPGWTPHRINGLPPDLNEELLPPRLAHLPPYQAPQHPATPTPPPPHDARSLLFPHMGEKIPLGVIHEAVDIRRMRDAVRLTATLFRDVERPWGTTENFPLSAHAFEVGLLLALAGAKPDTIIAGFLHDLLEEYIPTEQAQLANTVRQRFGPEVLRLIRAVTEPPKTAQAGNWLTRKGAALQQLLESDSEVAMVSCAAKISTLAAGNKFLEERQLAKWTSGSFEENLEFFRRLRAAYEVKRVPKALLVQFDLELACFAQGAPKGTS